MTLIDNCSACPGHLVWDNINKQSRSFSAGSVYHCFEVIAISAIFFLADLIMQLEPKTFAISYKFCLVLCYNISMVPLDLYIDQLNSLPHSLFPINSKSHSSCTGDLLLCI